MNLAAQLDIKSSFFNRLIWVAGLAFLFSSCQPTHQRIEPIITFTAQPHQLALLPTAFPPLSVEEQQQEWAKELILGDAFAKELDLYRAITCYKRARILIPPQLVERALQIDYDLILSYYLGHKYTEATAIFETSALTQVNPLFPAFNNLLLILFDAYNQSKQAEKAECILELIQKYSPETAQDLSLYDELKRGDLEAIEASVACHPQATRIQTDLDIYYQNAKSPRKARALNAILPGAGYYYVGQKKAALTSFIINSLFSLAAFEFFRHGYPAAGLITTSLEAGWYFGGINGAGIEAEEFNTRLYEGVGRKILTENQLFPLLMFETAF